MKKFYKLIATTTMSLLTVGVFAQTAGNVSHPVNGRTFKNSHKLGAAKQLSRNPQAASSTIILNYDSADAAIWEGLGVTYYHNNGQLMNAHYKYPTDTVGNNPNLINYIGVAFDSIVDAYGSPVDLAGAASQGLTVDTVIIPIVHKNTSGLADTLDVQLFSCNKWGYPTNNLLKDYMVIGTKISDTNSSAVIGTALVPINTAVTGPGKFYIQATYKGAKTDSCWFIYGFGGFSGSCAGGTYTLADSTNFSTIQFAGGKKRFTDNSFQYWQSYLGGTAPAGFLPDSTGGGVFIPCNGGTTFVAGDGDNYFEDVDIYAQITFVNTVGINNVTANGLNVGQNFPNPTNGTTQINYSVTKSSDVVFTVNDITGREIVNNTYNNVTPGQHVVSVSTANLNDGIYFYTFNVNGNKVTKKMVVTK